MIKRAGKSKAKASKPEVDALKNQLARALADYDNLRKRVEREREEIGKLAKAMIVARLLPIYDMIEGAQKHLRDSGLAITIEEFGKVLKEEGIEKILVNAGDKFDEALHEAVEVVEVSGKRAAGPEGKIAEVVLSGWRFSEGKVIRPAKVKVYGKPSSKKEELEKEMARGDYV